MSTPDDRSTDESHLHAGDLTIDNPIEQRADEHFDEEVGVDKAHEVDEEHQTAPDA